MKTKCPICSTIYTLSDDAEGTPVNCNNCGELFRVTRLPTSPLAKRCPSCNRLFGPGVKICVECGINIGTGRSIITSKQIDENTVHSNTKNILSVVSWFSPVGIYPIASEAYARRKPIATWTLVSVTVIATVLFWSLTRRASTIGIAKQAMLWTGGHPKTADHITLFLRSRDYGSDWAFERELRQLAKENVDRSEDELIVEAYHKLSLSERPIGEFQLYQLISHAFLHADLLHLAGNMLFFLVIGIKVNALVGNIAFSISYLLCAVLAGVAQCVASMSAAPTPVVGASGAIMGLAGMYMVLFPIQRVHMTAWIRVLALFFIRIFTMRGFIVVLFYIGFDVLFVIMSWEDGTAHWAHLGGFLAGFVLGLALLISRQVDAGGADILSAIFGRHAWRWIGSPSERATSSFLSRLS